MTPSPKLEAWILVLLTLLLTVSLPILWVWEILAGEADRKVPPGWPLFRRILVRDLKLLLGLWLGIGLPVLLLGGDLSGFLCIGAGLLFATPCTSLLTYFRALQQRRSWEKLERRWAKGRRSRE